ncbi:MAG: NADH-quinone oxidoreductase subunit N [Candidatus Tokpelaia sp. JSC161]|jgi:NADH-quinone oxidoreductase subunit N|nr:MAG: NADH-quinone oxidoreductase subunit N [Candidatus Tokpelaia sp. JSC161]
MKMALMIQLRLLLPEVVVAIGAVCLLLVGLFLKDSYERLVRLAMAILMSALFLLIAFPSHGMVFGDALIIDAFSDFMKILVLGGTVIVLLISINFLRVKKIDRFEFPVLILFATLGMMFMISAGNMLSLYLGIELQSLALYVLAAIDRDDLRATEAGVKYFVLGALSSGLLLYGISLIYGYTGSIGFSEISNIFSRGTLQVGVIFGMVFVLAALAFKISAVPFHMWTPDVYEGAPTPVTAFFATAPKVAAISLITRLVIRVFASERVTIMLPAWQQIVIFIGLGSMIVGAFSGIGQRNIKRLMAYSSISHMGYALVGLSSGTLMGVQSVIIYMLIYMSMTLGLFSLILAMKNPDGYMEKIDDLSGLARTDPFLALIVTLLLFSFASIPFLAGFFAKWYTFGAAVGEGFFPLVLCGMLASVISVFYYLRIVSLIWFNKERCLLLPISSELRFVLIVSGIFVSCYVFFGVWIMPLAEKAARSLF